MVSCRGAAAALEGEHVLEPVDDATVQLQPGRAGAGAPPALERARADPPALGQLGLHQVADAQVGNVRAAAGHAPLLHAGSLLR